MKEKEITAITHIEIENMDGVKALMTSAFFEAADVIGSTIESTGKYKIKISLEKVIQK